MQIAVAKRDQSNITEQMKEAAAISLAGAQALHAAMNDPMVQAIISQIDVDSAQRHKEPFVINHPLTVTLVSDWRNPDQVTLKVQDHVYEYDLPLSELRRLEEKLSNDESKKFLGRPGVMDVIGQILKKSPDSTFTLEGAAGRSRDTVIKFDMNARAIELGLRESWGVWCRERYREVNYFAVNPPDQFYEKGFLTAPAEDGLDLFRLDLGKKVEWVQVRNIKKYLEAVSELPAPNNTRAVPRIESQPSA